MSTGSIKFKVTALIGFFMFFILMLIVANSYVTNLQSVDAGRIDIAGRQRMLTQKMTKEVLALVYALESESSTIENLRKGLSETAFLFDRSLNAIRDGGMTIEADGKETSLPESSGEEKEQLNKVTEMWVQFRSSIDQIADPKVDIYSVEFSKAVVEIEKGNVPLLKETNRAVVLLKSVSEKRAVFLSRSVMIVAIILSIVGSVVSWMVANRVIVAPIVQTADIMESVAGKDFTNLLTLKADGEIGKMGQAVNSVIKTLGEIFSKILEVSTILASSSDKLFATSAEIAKGADDQAAESERIATAMGEMSATVTDVAKNTQSAAEMARNAQSVATKGGEVVSAAVSGIEQLTGLVENTADEVRRLGENSEQIGEIISVIDDIADQTNLLALNAAIEAARAGEQGRGFAVVADEVRKLAERTTKATAEVRERIGMVQEETSKVVESMEKGAEMSGEGIKLVREAGSALGEIVQSVDKVSDKIQQIATAAEEQSVTAEEISNNVVNIAGISNQTASKVKESSEVVQGLNKTAEELMILVKDVRA